MWSIIVYKIVFLKKSCPCYINIIWNSPYAHHFITYNSTLKISNHFRFVSTVSDSSHSALLHPSVISSVTQYSSMKRTIEKSDFMYPVANFIWFSLLIFYNRGRETTWLNYYILIITWSVYRNRVFWILIYYILIRENLSISYTIQNADTSYYLINS